MGIFGNLFGGSAGTSAANSGFGDSIYNNSELLGIYKDLSYAECKDIYRYWPLGKRIASALPNFAMSADRIISFDGHPPEIKEKFESTLKEYYIDRAIRQAAIYMRVYGMAGMFIAHKKGPNAILTRKDLDREKIALNILDPLCMNSMWVEQDPTKTDYLRVHIPTLWGKKYNKKRLCIIYNDIPLYYKFNPSSFSFSGASVYQNMTLLIQSWNRCIVALQRMATKAGSIVKSTKEVAAAHGISIEALERNLEMIRNMQNDGIAQIQNGETLEFFQLTGIQEVDAIVQAINTALMMALNDTPSGILLDKNLSVGLNDGTEDMKAILMSVNHFRENTLRPLYEFVDKYMLYSAFDNDFIKEIAKEYPEVYSGKNPNLIFEEIFESYKWEWGELYPLNEKEQLETNSMKLDIYEKVKNLGATQKDIEEELNAEKIFKTEITLEEPVKLDGMEENDEHGDNSFSYSDDDSDGEHNSSDNSTDKSNSISKTEESSKNNKKSKKDKEGKEE